MTTEDKFEKKRVLARRGLHTEDYASAKKAYQYILDNDPDDVEAMFYAPYCALMVKRKVDFKSDSNSFNKNLRVVFDSLIASALPAEEKDVLCGRFLKDIRRLCKSLCEKLDVYEDKIPENDPTYERLSCITYRNDIWKIPASACVYAANEGRFDLNGCKYEMLETLDETLQYYGWFGTDGIVTTLHQVRNTLLDEMQKRGDDISSEIALGNRLVEERHNRMVEYEVTKRIEALIGE